MTTFPVPQGIPSAITLPELALLQRYAHEAKTVLEIGTHYGFSCIGMALAGAHVTSVDPHYEGPADAPDTWETFQANVRRHGVGGKIDAYREAIEDWHEGEREIRWFTEYGLIFIDGNHIWPCPGRDAEIANLHLSAPGYIAFHDVSPRWPGVWRAAHELEVSGWRKLDQIGTLAVYQK